jgi:hypothetical protein
VHFFQTINYIIFECAKLQITNLFSHVIFKAQMPIQVELEPQTQCSYFSFCSLDDVTGQNDDDETQSPPQQQLIDVWVDASTLSRHNQVASSSMDTYFPS